LLNGFDQNGKRRDSDQWYVQATYKLPTATKIGIAYGESTLDGNRNADAWNKLEDNMLTVGAYHPLTKSVNLVAEYSQVQSNLKGTANGKLENEAKTVSLGAILFF
jgi:predicted porin